MKPMGQEPDEIALMDALASAAKTSDKALLLHSQFKNAVGQYRLGIIDRDEYLRWGERIESAFLELQQKGGEG